MTAEHLIKDLSITALPVDPFAIASGRKIEVRAKPARDAGVSGMLIRVGNDFCIAYATHIDNEPFQRFSISHELGHYFLPEHIDAVIDTNGIHESRAGFASNNRYEMEADRFAAGLLMPRHLFLPALERAGEGLAAVDGLSALCKTSLHATAIRYSQCTDDPVAIVVSDNHTQLHISTLDREDIGLHELVNEMQRLLLCGLVGFHCSTQCTQRLLNDVNRERALGRGVHTLLRDDRNNIFHNLINFGSAFSLGYLKVTVIDAEPEVSADDSKYSRFLTPESSRSIRLSTPSFMACGVAPG